MASHNLAQIDIDDLEIIGYSIAGEESVVAVPQLDVCFDIGKAPQQVIAINHVLLTHGHMDHAAGIGYYLSHRNFCGLPAGTVLAPRELTEPIADIAKAWERLDGNNVPVNLVGVKAGDEYQIKPNLFAKVFPTKHSRGSVGYTIIERRKKLKEEYLKLNSNQIVELKRQGIEIDYTLDLPLVTYFGDTNCLDFWKIDYIRKSKILIAECTFYEDEHISRAKAGRHMHINKFAELLEKMENEHIIVTHTTQRTGMGQVKRMLKKNLPAEIYKKMTILMDRKNIR